MRQWSQFVANCNLDPIYKMSRIIKAVLFSSDIFDIMSILSLNDFLLTALLSFTWRLQVPCFCLFQLVLDWLKEHTIEPTDLFVSLF